VVASVGALSAEKRVTAAIEAVAATPDAFLLITGDGPLRSVIEAEATACLPGRHLTLGPVADIRTVYDASDALVLLSETEGQPGVLIEAGLCALPAVATDVGGVASVVVDHRTGMVVPAGAKPADVAVALTAALDQRDAMGASARAHCVERFSFDVVAQAFERVLAAAISA